MTEPTLSMVSNAALAAEEQEEATVAVKQRLGLEPFATTEPMFRIVTRMLMLFRSGEHIIACCGIASDDPSATLAAHLAVALVRLDQGPVLLADANFRVRGVSELAQAQRRKGLADLLASDENDASVIQAGNPEGLHVLPAGDRAALSPSLLASSRMTQLVECFRRYRFVVLDVGALLVNWEASLIASHADVIVAAANVGERTRSELRQFKTESSRLGARLLGVILTEAK